MRRLALAVAASLALSAAAFAQDEVPPSRAGTVLFRMPSGWQRSEMPDCTVLAPADPAARAYSICIRPAAPAKATVADTLAADLEVIGRSYRAQPASELSVQKHPAGYDAAVRGYVLTGADGRALATYVYVLQAGTQSAAIEFSADRPEKLDAKAMSDFVVGCRLAHAQVVVAGEPALTLYDLEETIDCIQWLLDAPFTAEQRGVFHDEIVDGWKKKDAETIQGVAQILEFRAELAKLPPDKQDVVRKSSEKELVAALRKETDRSSKLAVEIYDASRRPIAGGEPALTRQQADSALELFYFVAGQLEGMQARPTTADKEEWAKRLAAGWEKLDVKVRRTFEVMPLTWSAARAGWAEMKETEREEIKAGFAQLDIVKEMRAAFAKVKSDAGTSADAAALQAKLTSNYRLTSTLLKTGFDSTMMQMAAMRNMTDSYRRWSYRPR
jgi:hypothetical protein